MQTFRITDYTQALHTVGKTKKTEIYVSIIARFTIKALQFESYYY